jgi:polyisoprenoid-binding protein YceI
MLATGWTGSATWDPADVGACALSVEVPVKKLSVDPPKLRAALKMEGELSESQRADVKKNMLSKSQLDAANHPTVTFTATQCVAKGDKVMVTGDLTLHGVTNTVTLPMTVTEDGATFEAKGTLKIKATDYGIEPFSAMLGALKNKNQMTLSIRLKGTK